MRHEVSVDLTLRGDSMPIMGSPRDKEAQESLFSTVHVTKHTKPFAELERFTIVSKMGEGSSGTVYSIRDNTSKKMKHLKEHYAVKIVEKGGLSKGKEARLRREYAIMNILHHPNIIRLRKVIENPFEICIVQELARRGDLLSRLESTKKARFEEAEARSYFVQICQGVKHMHDNGFVHRDLKLENILICERSRDNTERLKIGDLGCGTGWREGLLHDQAVGTLFYASPEIVSPKGQYQGPEVDIWSLGVMLYVMLVGKFPFRGNSPTETRKNIQFGTAKLKARFSRDLRLLLKQMLDKNPKTRLTISEVLMHRWCARHGSAAKAKKKAKMEQAKNKATKNRQKKSSSASSPRRKKIDMVKTENNMTKKKTRASRSASVKNKKSTKGTEKDAGR